MGKTSKKQASKPSEKSSKKKELKEPAESPGQDKTFDFGGLPDRDLKKNLGCG